MKILYCNRGPGHKEYTDWHTHSFWQLDYMIDDLGGKAFFESEERCIALTSGTGIIIPPYCSHCLTYTRGQFRQPMKFECAEASGESLSPMRIDRERYPDLAARLFEDPQPIIEVEQAIYNHYLMILLLSLYQEQLKRQDKKFQPRDSRLVKTVRWINRNHYKKINFSMLSRQAGLSESQLRRLFQQELQTNPMDYVRAKRIDSAKQHLIYSDMNIGQIANTLGFPNQHIFSRSFKLQTGLSPSEYRKTAI
jgi:AraC-like DNA-binding protein